VPVDVGVAQPTKPQDMAIELWLNTRMSGSLNVVDLGINFELLPMVVSKKSDRDIIYTLVMEDQVRSLFTYRILHALCEPVNTATRGRVRFQNIANAIIY
jgi:hypothetical protein